MHIVKWELPCKHDVSLSISKRLFPFEMRWLPANVYKKVILEQRM